MKKNAIFAIVVTALLFIGSMILDIVITGQMCSINPIYMMALIKLQCVLYMALAFSVMFIVKTLKNKNDLY